MIKELLQWQTLSNQQLANIVRHETEYCFQKKDREGQRMPRLLERVPPQQLKDEMQNLFFKSLSERLEGLGIKGNSAVPYITWHNSWDKIYEYGGNLRKNKIHIRLIYLHFIRQDEKEYYMYLNGKVKEIVEFIIKKNICQFILNDVRNMKPKTEKPLKYTPNDRMTNYEYDEYAITLMLGKAISKELESEERHIRNGSELEHNDRTIELC
jgi:hypothetical protein